MAKIKPFRFHLAKVSPEQNEIVSGLLEFLPATGARQSFHLAVRKTLQKYIPDIRYYLDRIEFTSFHDFYSKLGGVSCVGVLGMEPFKEKIFIEIDPLLSSLVIEKLLGGKGEGVAELKPLTETEQGVIEFLLLKLITQIHKLSEDKARLHFRLDKMVLETSHLRGLATGDEAMVCLKVHMALLNHSGFVNIYLPRPVLLEGFLKNMPGDKSAFEQEQMKEQLKTFENLPLELWSGLGEAVVSYGDLQNLEAGDVVLFDQTGLVKRKDGWRGEVKICTGNGDAGGLTALWDGFEEGGLCRITGTLAGGTHG